MLRKKQRLNTLHTARCTRGRLRRRRRQEVKFILVDGSAEGKNGVGRFSLARQARNTCCPAIGFAGHFILALGWLIDARGRRLRNWCRRRGYCRSCSLRPWRRREKRERPPPLRARRDQVGIRGGAPAHARHVRHTKKLSALVVHREAGLVQQRAARFGPTAINVEFDARIWEWLHLPSHLVHQCLGPVRVSMGHNCPESIPPRLVRKRARQLQRGHPCTEGLAPTCQGRDALMDVPPLRDLGRPVEVEVEFDEVHQRVFWNGIGLFLFSQGSQVVAAQHRGLDSSEKLAHGIGRRLLPRAPHFRHDRQRNGLVIIRGRLLPPRMGRALLTWDNALCDAVNEAEAGEVIIRGGCSHNPVLTQGGAAECKFGSLCTRRCLFSLPFAPLVHLCDLRRGCRRVDGL
mmetsp:Transcript_56658/g.161449  ORF Transcript_56658/g.161449 Transcript_56658/m.161449 type:complete len:403 (+) Transcript_56658:327-1535(+)